MNIEIRTQSMKGADLYWTAHAKAKMRQYRLSEQRVRRVLHAPKRVEEGIAPETIAYMQPTTIKTGISAMHGARKEAWTQELWVMVSIRKGRRNVVSAWRYPGMTKPGDPPPIEILRELRGVI